VRGIRLLFGLLLALAACDAGPSAVLPDGAGKAPAEQVQPAKAPVWAQNNQEPVEEASMPVVDEAPVAGNALPVTGQRAKITATRYGDWPLWSQNRKYSADENAHYHFQKHGPEFSAKSYPDYMAMVHGFVHNPPAGTETLKRTNGDTLFYDPKGNVFAVMTRAGAPRTMFRPDNGAAYWRQQKIIESQRRASRRESYSE